MGRELLLQVSEEGAEAERLGLIISYLRQELLQLDVESVATPVIEAPQGTRASGIAAIGSLIVALGQSSEGLRSVVSTIRNWLSRGDKVQRSVKLEIDGDVLELSQASTADQELLIRLFVSRHAGGR